MSMSQLEIQVIVALVAFCCAILGVFLVLRKMALISDAISHSILPGIVIGFFVTQDLNSPWLILFAGITGLFTVVLVEWLYNTKLLKEDTSIGLVFPFLFSIGVILIAQKANDIHLDTDAVLLGEIAFAPFNQWYFMGLDFGPKAIWLMGGILFVIMNFLIFFYKELKISTFDVELAATLGLAPALMHYALMLLSSFTIVGAFDAVGSVLVVGFIVVPASTAYLISNELKPMLFRSVIIGIMSAIIGYWIAHFLDASIAGSIMTVMGLIFTSVFMFYPKVGYISRLIFRNNQIKEIALLTLLIHVNNHKEEKERKVGHLHEHINWSKTKSAKILNEAKKKDYLIENNTILSITQSGKELISHLEKSNLFTLHQ